MHIVIAHLCRQLDKDHGHGEDSENPPEDDVDIFRIICTGGDVHVTSGGIINPTPDSGEEEEVNVFTKIVEMGTYMCTEFLVACIDSGAQRMVVGKSQA